MIYHLTSRHMTSSIEDVYCFNLLLLVRNTYGFHIVGNDIQTVLYKCFSYHPNCGHTFARTIFLKTKTIHDTCQVT